MLEGGKTMAICEECGTTYDIDCVFEDLSDDYGSILGVIHFDKQLCYECAKEAFEHGEYYANCDECGKRFYMKDAEEVFENECPDYHLEATSILDFCDLILCSDCAVERLRKWYDEMNQQGAFDEESDERISVYDAALIWASNGKDEDYTFGYTEEELEEQL